MKAFLLKKNDVVCPVCQRITPYCHVEKHHLIPRSKKGKETILVCCDCGDQLHKLFSVKELAKEYNTIEKILSCPKVTIWVDWIKKRPVTFGFCMKSKKSR
jgi:hypothetical protein